MTRHKTIWCDRGFYPTHYGFCPSEKAWIAELKRLKIVDMVPYPTSDACCNTFESTLTKRDIILVTVSTRADTISPLQVVGLIVHEATHVWQFIRKNIGERDPGRECEAYALQAISQELLSAYSRTRRKIL